MTGFQVLQYACCRDGEIGRRTGLKIRRWRHREGSTPSPGTILNVTLQYYGLVGADGWGAHECKYASTGLLRDRYTDASGYRVCAMAHKA